MVLTLMYMMYIFDWID